MNEPNGMNIIIVAKPHATPRALDLKCWRMRAKLAGLALLCILCFGGAGFAAALLFANPQSRALHELYALQAQIETQRQNVAQLESSSQRNLNALAVQLGSLQARALRLDALGQRLAQVGKLDADEFDFGAAPGLGGPEDAEVKPQPLNADLAANIASLRGQFRDEETRLNVLEQLLLDRRVDNELLPKGYPVTDGYIGSGFGTRTDPISGGVEHHLGIDFDAPIGAAIHAVADGVVTFVGQRSGYGNVVEIDHGNGYMTRYAHNSKNVATVGERVHAGQTIARVGETGRATGPHCHFEVWLNGRPVNPIAYVNAAVKKI
jgi:murein DD-endopeptidase MepM/ murein hydrolase activator NlpD